MQPHVQERIGFAVFRRPVPVQQIIALLEHRMVFRMFGNHLGQHVLQCRQWQALLVLAPDVKVHAAEVFAIVAEKHFLSIGP